MKRKFGKSRKSSGSRRKFGKEKLLTICVGEKVKKTHRRCDNRGKGTIAWFLLPLIKST
jgi:hypothetical protein